MRGLYYNPRTESETDGEMTICKVIVIVVSILMKNHHQEFVDFVFLCAIYSHFPYLSRIVGFVVRLLCRSF